VPSFTTAVPDLLVHGPLVQLLIGPSKSLIQSVGSQKLAVPQPVLALVDTGASGTVLNPQVFQQLGIQPVSSVPVHTPSTVAPVNCNQYQINVYFPHGVTVEDVLAIEAPMGGQNIQCLIGRDILQHGVLIYIGYSNQFTLSF
jgi:predicted aspartyl protease